MLLIFDWDGTLSDSADRIVDCLQKAAQSAGFRVCSRDEIRNIIGLGLPEAMNTLYPDLGPAEHELIRQQYVAHFVAEDEQASPFFDGVVQGLTVLRDAGFLLTVATGKSRRGLDRVLKNVDMVDFFDSSRCADETLSKPNPLMLNELLTEFSKEPEQAIMIGDTEYDMSMAQQINMPRVGVSYGAHDVKRLHGYEPLLCVDHFSEFVDWAVTHFSR